MVSQRSLRADRLLLSQSLFFKSFFLFSASLAIVSAILYSANGSTAALRSNAVLLVSMFWNGVVCWPLSNHHSEWVLQHGRSSGGIETVFTLFYVAGLYLCLLGTFSFLSVVSATLNFSALETISLYWFPCWGLVAWVCVELFSWSFSSKRKKLFVIRVEKVAITVIRRRQVHHEQPNTTVIHLIHQKVVVAYLTGKTACQPDIEMYQHLVYAG